MIIPRLALRNLLGAGLKTWLNVVVLSFAFVIIIWMQGLYDGMGGQAKVATTDAEYGSGQYWQEDYDPFDPLSIQDAHAVIPESLQTQIDKGLATGVLISQATIYPEGRLHTIQMKGIDPAQSVVNLPTQFLDQDGEELPALIGTRMAKNTGLEIGDTVTVRWRDAQGTLIAGEWPDWMKNGEPRPESDRITWSTRGKIWSKDDPLLPSGLLGPVRLITAQE